VHASLLPELRGAAPAQWAIARGYRETGVTIMRVVRELDAGPMLSAETVPIPPDATTADIEAALAVCGAALLLSAVDDLAAGRAVETPQDHEHATLAPKISKEEGDIDWTADATAIHNKVRGLQPWPLASTTRRGARYVIRRSAVADGIAQASPGEIVKAHGDELVVAAGGGSQLRILEIQPEGRRSMTAREFLAGHHFATGDRFGT
jgi:methionyl-tRNA formyltransferase